MRIERVQRELPPDIGSLASAAAREGVRNVSMLIAAWEAGEQRFDVDGAALFAASDGDALAGIGGVKRETEVAESAMRMHRFYVHPLYRRRGAGGRLAQTVMDHALSHASVLTCNARATPLAAPFWESMGFVKAEADGYTHIFRTGMNSGA